ncbi:hypothetical protein B0H19DRAFT_7158 [Mycena capillaripes]|nr:hypothetical protein B0H19DRAFT_7158 [Mycena capillaripes]
MEKTSTNEGEGLEDYSYMTLTLGIWRLLLPKESFSSKFSVAPGFSLSWDKWKEQISFLPTIWRFMAEMYLLSPGLVLLNFMLGFASTMEGTLMLYTSTRLLRTVEVGLVEGRMDVNAILQAVVIRMTCVILTSTISWAKEHVTPLLQTRVILHVEEYILRARLRLDLPTGADKNTTPKVTAGRVWQSFEFLSVFFQRAFQLATQILFILQQMNGGFIFTMLSLVSTVLITTSSRRLFRTGMF